MTLYGRELSPYVARVALAARFKGVGYTLVPLPSGAKGPEFRKINPLGKVPVLKDGKTVICESAVIVEYLEAKGKAKKLVPKSATAAAMTRQIGAVATEYLQDALKKFAPFMQAPIENLKAVEAIAAELGTYLDILTDMMPKGRYAAGKRFSIADVYVLPALFSISMVTTRLGLVDPIISRSKLKKYMAAMQKDKVAGDVLKAMAADWKSITGR